jgi:pyruvate formate lyase activating enzyme
LIEQGLIDYIAMDIKTSLKKYNIATGINIDTSKIKNSIEIIMKSDIDYEFRTTVVPGIVTQDDIEDVGELIKGAKLFSIQQFENSLTLNSNFKNIQPYRESVLQEFSKILKKYVKKIKINNIKTLV